MKIEDKILELIKPYLEKENIKIYKIEYKKENNNNFLKIYLETDNIDTCVKATKIINPLLDKEDLIDEQYILEVSSKGMEE